MRKYSPTLLITEEQAETLYFSHDLSEREGFHVITAEVRRYCSTLLIAEEQAETRCFWRDLFERQGFNVITAENGAAAWELFRAWSFFIRAVLIGDLMQPPLDGLDLIRRIKPSKPLAKLPIVVATSYGSDYAHLAQTAGATTVIRKFDEVERLVEAIHQTLPAPR